MPCFNEGRNTRCTPKGSTLRDPAGQSARLRFPTIDTLNPFIGLRLSHDGKTKRKEGMAISFVRAKSISRGSGQSAVACSAYRSCTNLTNEQNNKINDYTRKIGLIAEGLHCPDGIIMDRENLWNLVEKTEKRKDARFAKEYIVAIPCEFEKEEQILVSKLIAEHLAKDGRFADWALHEPNQRGDDRNIHAHFMITERSWNIENETFETKKNREWNKKEYLQEQKIAIAEIFNSRLRMKRLPEIDPRSYLEKIESGLDVPEPQKHKGVTRTNRERNQVEKLERIQRQIKQMEELGYGNTERNTRLDRPIDSRSSNIEKPIVEGIGGNEITDPTKTRDNKRNKSRDSGFSW